MKYDTALFLLLFIIVLSVPTSFAFASEDNDDSKDHDDDRYDDDKDDDRYDDDKDDDRYDDDKDDDRYDDDKDDDRYDDDKDDDRYDDDKDDDRYDDDKDDDRYDDDSKTSEFSERKVRAETLGFQSKIEIEIEFVSDVTDTDQLIDQIINRFSLTREEADKELRTERSDDQRLEKSLK